MPFEAVRLGPEDGAAWLALAQELEREGRFPEALAALEQARRLSEAAPSLREAVLERRAFLAACLGKVRTEELLQDERGLARYVRALRGEAIARHLDKRLGRKPPRDRGSDDARRRAERQLDEARRVVGKRVDRALSCLLEALREYPGLELDVLVMGVSSLVAEKREEEAEDLLRGLCEATADLGMLQRLVAFYREVPAVRPDRRAVRRQRLADTLDRIARLYPSCAGVEAERGEMLVEEGRLEEAAEACRRLMSSPASMAAGAPLATLLEAVRRSGPEAFARGDEWVRRARQFGIRDEERQLAWEEALRANPRELRAAVGLVEALLESRSYPEALQVATAAFEQAPDVLEVARMLGRAWLEAGLNAKALDAALYVLGRWPHPEALSFVASALQACDRMAEAGMARAASAGAWHPEEWPEAARTLLGEAARMDASGVMRA